MHRFFNWEFDVDIKFMHRENQMDENKVLILDGRTYFIGDRAASSQIMMFLISGAISLLIELVGLSRGFILYFWWICIVFPLIGLVILVVFTESLYYDHHWHTSFVLLLMTWIPLVTYLGVLIDDLFAGLYNAFWLSLFLSLIIGAGYFLAKILRMRRHSSNVMKVGAVISAIIITITVLIGSIMYSSARKEFGIEGYDIIGIHNCQSCIFSIYILISGIGIVISMVFYSYMFYCLFDPEGLDVEEDPPNELYLKVMRISWIMCFLSWLLLLVLFPPIAGGGKGKKGGAGRARPRPRARSSMYLNSLRKSTADGIAGPSM